MSQEIDITRNYSNFLELNSLDRYSSSEQTSVNGFYKKLSGILLLTGNHFLSQTSNTIIINNLMAQTYISKVIVDLWKQEVTLEWTGPNAAAQEKGPFHCSPGEGVSGVNCDDIATSKRSGTSCTPKGEFPVNYHERRFSQFPQAEWVTRFQDDSRGIALHYYPIVPEYPDSNGCVRIASLNAAKLIYDNTKSRQSVVSVREELRPRFGIVLKRGAKSQDVRKIQRRLVEKGYRLGIDGDFGPRTEAVVKQFQKDKRLSADGIFGRQTYQVLFA